MAIRRGSRQAEGEAFSIGRSVDNALCSEDPLVADDRALVAPNYYRRGDPRRRWVVGHSPSAASLWRTSQVMERRGP